MRSRAAGAATMVASRGRSRNQHAYGVGNGETEPESSVLADSPPAQRQQPAAVVDAHVLQQVNSTRQLRHELSTQHGIPVLSLMDLDHDGTVTKGEAREALREMGDDNAEDVARALASGSVRHNHNVRVDPEGAQSATALERLAAGTILRLPCRHPPFIPDHPDVSVACKVINLADIDCVNQAFFVTFDLWVSWADPDLDPQNLKDTWVPAVHFYNAIAHTVFTRGARNVGDHSFTGKTIRRGVTPVRSQAIKR